MAPVIMVVIVALLMAWVMWRNRQFSIARRVLRRLKAAHPNGLHQYSYGHTCEVTTINDGRSRRRVFVVSVTDSGISLHPVTAWGEEPPLFIAPDQVRWFGRPRKYTYGTNMVWLHIEQEGQWRLVKMRLDRSSMQNLIRALKPVLSSDPELVTYYRRRRPYVHYGPVQAHPATQDIYGAWQLAEPVTLYLMPRYLVVLEGIKVRRVLPLAAIQNVAAIQRLDRPQAEGLVRFTSGEETLAFALPKHGDFAEALAEAAKRTLEDPVSWQRKKKKHSESLVFEDDEDLIEEFFDEGSEGSLDASSLEGVGDVEDEEWLARVTAHGESDEEGAGRN